ncbi:acyltransferase [Herbaspirillum sp.]|uniref:acyltransferase family protein n=1 Tax=Herbaspirillum sp. TaxID=1890675 RepID=UPI0025C40DB2|nr:acyltransferase [Herbaspirillum sp.]
MEQVQPQVAMRSVSGRLAAPMAAHPSVMRLHELDGLRGILALLVVSYHMYGPLPLVHAAFAGHAAILTQAWYAVDVFFLMSGFVMMHVYGKTFEERPSLATFRLFMRARFARLYPVHLAALTLMLIVMLPFLAHTAGLFSWHGRYSLGAFAASLLMLHGPWVEYRSWNYPAWSISAEWHAYLLFPAMWLLARRAAGARAVLLLACCTLIPFAVYLMDAPSERYPTNGVVLLARAIPLFFGGMLLYRLHHLNRIRWRGGAAAVCVAATVALLCSDAAPAAVLLAPCLVLSALSKNWFQSLLRSKPLLFLGKISYSLYMTHALVEMFFVEATLRAASRYLHAELNAGLAVSFGLWLAGVVLALALGYVAWRWLEEPARRWLMKRSDAVARA